MIVAAAASIATSPPGAAAEQSPVVVDGPALGLTPFVPLEGAAPPSTVDHGGVPLGAIRMMAGNFTPGATAGPAGQVLSTAAYPNASAALGSTFGGDGSTTFGIPDLRGRTPIGAGGRPGGAAVALGEQVGANRVTIGREAMPVAYGGGGSPLARRPPGLGLTYLVRTSGRNASRSFIAFDSLGVVVPYAGTVVPAGWTPADGRLLSIAEHPDLFAVLGSTFGGDGSTTFALPDLRNRAAVQAGCFYLTGCRAFGEQFGSESVAITQAHLPDALGGSRLNVDNNAPALALNYICNGEGLYPPRTGDFHADPVDPFIGEVFLYAGDRLDRQVRCSGGIFSIQQNSAWFSILGTTFGGNGSTTFQLPNLVGRTAVGAGSGPGLDPVDYGGWGYGYSSLPLWSSPSVWPASTAPGAPTGVAAVAGTGQASVSWTAPVSNGGSPITGYVITPYLGTAALTPRRYDTVALTQVVSGLERSRSYTFTVAATNANGTGLDSLPSNAVAPK